MATLNLAVSADTIGDVPLKDGLETSINTALSTLLTNNIFAAQYLAQDQQRRAGEEYNVLITYSSTGAATLTSPFQVRVFQATTLDAAKALQTTFCTDNPTFFFGTSTFQNLNVVGNDTPFSIIQFYSEDATGGAQNWQADQGGSMTAGVTTWNGRVGVVVPAISDYLASQVDNDSGVAGAFVSDALDTNEAAAAAAQSTANTASTNATTALNNEGKIGSTGIINGGLLTVNGGDTTLFDISDGRGLIIDKFTTPAGDNQPVKVTWTGLTGITPAHAATLVTFIAINSAGTVVQQASAFTVTQRKTLLVIGAVVTQDGTNVDSVADVSSDSTTDYMSSDMANAVGDVNTSGNAFTAAAADLTIQRSAGTTFGENLNRLNNIFDANNLTSGADAGVTFIYIYSDNAGSFTPIFGQTDIDPDSFDDGSGILAAVTNNRWTNQLIYFFPGTNIIIVQFGEEIYATQDAAEAAAPNQSFTSLSDNFNASSIRTVLSVKEGGADLSDAALAAFFQTGKFGHGAAGSSSTNPSIQNFQSVYDNSVDPQVTTDATLGPMTTRRGSAADTDIIEQWKTGAGAVVASMTGEGKLTLAALLLGGISVDDILISSDGVSTSDTVLVTAGYVDAHSGGGEAITKDVTQATHGFIVGDWVRLSGSGTYTKAQADSAANAEVVGRVSAVPGVNDFTLTMAGYVTGMPSVAVNTGFVLDPSTAGAMTSTAPTTVGDINRFIFRSDSATTGYVQILRGVEVGPAAEGAKMWVKVTNGGVPSIDDSFNITSLTDNGPGDVTVTIATDFANANWAPVGEIFGAGAFSLTIISVAVGSVNINTQNSAGTLTDLNFSLAGFGDQ